jgi:hypothetical protein
MESGSETSNQLWQSYFSKGNSILVEKSCKAMTGIDFELVGSSFSLKTYGS